MMETLTSKDQVIYKDARYILGTYARMPVLFTHGDGMRLYDSDGNAYLDFGAGIAVNALGHAHPEIVEAIREQAARLGHVSNLYHTAPMVELAEKLCVSSFADKVFFSNSGAEAVEAALKIARKHSRRKIGDEATEIIAFQGGFHGRTFGALSVTPREKYQAPFRPLLPDVRVLPFNDPAAFIENLTGRTSAVIVEPVQGEGGIRVATTEFMKTLRENCDRTGALLIVDEIQSGLGRTGRLWAHQHYGIEPDIMTSAKALGGGLPIGATMMKDTVAGIIEKGDHGSTFGGNPIAAAAAMAVLNFVSNPETLRHVNEMSAYLVDQLNTLESPVVREVRALGLMIGIELSKNVSDMIDQAAKKGVILLSAGEKVLRLLPPYIVQKSDVDQLIKTLKEVL